MSQKRVAAIHDISCLGKCSLTVALPIISAAGVETAIIPTAILSTHTGGFTGYTLRDLSDDIVPVAQHWKKEGITVDAVYTGYLCSKSQIASVITAAQLIKGKDSLVIVDPVMADNGKLYKGFDDDFPGYMLELCSNADIITPNITEASFLLGEEYKQAPYTEEYIFSLVNALYNKTGAKVVLTGVSFDEDSIGTAVFDGKDISYIFSERLARSYHGTGDIFSSTLTAALMNNRNLKDAAQIAVNFTCDCIRHTMNFDSEMRYGVNFEAMLPNLINYLDLR